MKAMIMPDPKKTLPANILNQFGADDGGFGSLASAAATNRPQPLQFKKGVYELGFFDKVPVPSGAQYVVAGAGEAWQRLERDTPPQRIARRPGEAFPIRAELGELDERLWPKFDGRPSDPWRLTYELYMFEPEMQQPVCF